MVAVIMPRTAGVFIDWLGKIPKNHCCGVKFGCFQISVTERRDQYINGKYLNV